MPRTGAVPAFLVALALAAVPPAAAHTEVLRAEPAPGQEVAGPIDEVELTFLDPILPGAEISVVDDAGRPVPGLAVAETSQDGLAARVGFDPLSGPGGYVVEYTFTARDGDARRETYRFTVTGPAAGTDGAGGGWARVAVAVVVVAALAGTLAVAVHRRRMARRADADVTPRR